MDLKEIKLCLLGDSGVGKSSLVYRFVSDAFSPNLETTIGASYMSKTLIVDNQSYKYQIWDTAGQEKYRGLAPMYYRGAAAAIIVYDITRAETFQTLKNWISELQQSGPQDIVLAIAGSKLDLKKNRQVDTKMAKDYADSIGALFAETSAMTAENVLFLFESISKRLPRDLLKSAPRLGVNMNAPTPAKKSWC